MKTFGTRLISVFWALVAPLAIAGDFYVAPSGSDTNSGSLANPFLTIQRAANVMVAGDTCYIRAGTYRETVVPANSGAAESPVAFRPYGSEVVTLSGADVVTGWSLHSGGVHKASFTGALGDKDQVFVDGIMMNLARWPNTSLDVSRAVKASADTGSYAPTNNSDGTRTGTYTDADLTQPAGFFNGAKIHHVPGVMWIAQTGTVTNYMPGTVDFRWKMAGTTATYAPVAGNPYFLFGLLSLLDAPGEWFIDSTSAQLYLWPPQNDSPTNHLVEVRRRDYGFNLSGKSHITVQGLRLFACAVNTSDASHHLTLDGLECLYVSHFSLIDTAGMWGYHMEDTGIILKGMNSTLRNSHIAFSAGNGVTILGMSNRIDNCVIHDVDYSGLDCSAINTGLSSRSIGHEICFNTCYNSGRGILLIRALTAGKVHHNVLYRSMLRTTDGGAIYTWGHDGQGTEIAYNRISDNVCGGYGAAGIYLDGNSTNFITHHNLIYNSLWALHYNLSSVNIKWFNNTAVAFDFSLWGGYYAGCDQAGSEVFNNLFTAAVTNYAEAAVSHNLGSNTAPLFVSANALDFQVMSGSPAIDAGIPHSPFTDGYNGAAPDIGAFEYGQARWSAGSTLAAAPPPGPTDLCASAADGNIRLTWKDSFTSQQQSLVDRSLDNKAYSEIAFLPAGTTNYTDAAVRKNVTYFYRVRVGESPNSNYRSVSVPGHDPFGTIQAESLEAQSGLTVSSSIGSCDNKDWAKYADIDFGLGATSVIFRLANGQTLTNLFIEVRLDGTNGTRIANVNVLGTGGWGNWSNVVSLVSDVSGTHDLFLVFRGGSGVCNLDKFSFKPVLPLSVPPVPQSITASAVAANQILVTWALTGEGRDGFKLERSGDNQSFVEIATVSPTTNTFTDSGLACGTRCYYRLRSYNKYGFSDYSEIVAATSWTALESWRCQYFGTILGTGDSANGADPDGDGMNNGAEYVAGTCPTNLASALWSLLEMRNGSPHIAWTPDLGAERVYTVEGRANLTGTVWGATNGASRFFRVRVGMP